MSATNLTQADVDRLNAMATVLNNVVNNGASGPGYSLAKLLPDGGTPLTGTQLKQSMAILIPLLKVAEADNASGAYPFPVQLPSFTLSTLPTASEWTGAMIYVSNATAGPVPCYSDGTNWRQVNTLAIVS